MSKSLAWEWNLHVWVLKSHTGCQTHTHDMNWKSHACGIAACQNPIQIFWWSYVNFSFKITRIVLKFNSCVYHNHIHTCQNHTLHVEINLVRVEITVLSVIITFVLAKISLRLEITLCVYKSHSCVFKSLFAYRNYTRASEHHILRSEIALLHVNITLCVY
jgi:hypothetical protein